MKIFCENCQKETEHEDKKCSECIEYFKVISAENGQFTIGMADHPMYGTRNMAEIVCNLLNPHLRDMPRVAPKMHGLRGRNE